MIAECKKLLGDEQGAAEYYALSDTTKGAPTMHTYFQCKALRAVGNTERADMLASSLVEMGNKRIATADVNDYYGVGSPAYPPFGYDIVKAHNVQGSILCAYGYLAEGKAEEANACIANVLTRDCADFSAYLFGRITK